MRAISTVFKHPLGKVNLPLKPATPGDQFPGWCIPTQVKETTIKLCKALGKQKHSIQTPPNSEGVMTAIEEENQLTIHWERDEYRHLVNEENLEWPLSLNHAKLILLKNRFPIVPEFNLRTQNDSYAVAQVKQQKLSRGRFKPFKSRKLVKITMHAPFSKETWTRIVRLRPESEENNIKNK